MAKDKSVTRLSEFDLRYIQQHLSGKNKVDFTLMKEANNRLNSALQKISNGVAPPGASTPLGESWSLESAGQLLGQLLARFEETCGSGIIDELINYLSISPFTG